MALRFVTLSVPPFQEGEAIVGRPLALQWRQRFDSTESDAAATSTRLRGNIRIDPLKSLEKDHRLVGPKGEMKRTFPIRLEVDRSRMTVPGELEHNYLRKATKNVSLVVEAGGKTPKTLGIHLGGGRFARFDRSAPEKAWALDRPPTLETCCRPFIPYLIQPPDFETPDFTRIELTRADPETDPQPANGWFDPIVWTTVAGPLPADGQDQPPLLRELIDSAWHVWPLISARRAPMACFLETWESQVRERNERDTLERLLWGPKSPHDLLQPTLPPWIAFLALDSLEGCFLVKDHGGKKPTRFVWQPAAEFDAAGMLLAKRLVESWGGDLSASPGLPPPVATGLTSLRRSRAHYSLATVPVEALEDAARLLREHDATRNLDSYQRIAQLIDSDAGRKACPAWSSAHLGTVLYRDDAGGSRTRLRFDHAEFLERFVRRWLLPRSPVRVRIPHPGAAGDAETCYDPFNSRTFGARRFFTDLARPRPEPVRRDEVLEIYGGPGWWHRWARVVHTKGADQHIRLRHAFILDSSKIGSRLGELPPDSTPRQEMRFY